MVQELTSRSTTARISAEEARLLYEDMVLGRLFEDKCAEMYYKGKMFGFVHLYNGQEAVSTGVIKALKPTDYVCSTYRDHVHALSTGIPPRAVMAELFGKATGCSKGRGGSMHLFSAEHNFLGGYAFVAEGIPVATGAAFSAKYRGTDQVTACFFGDGACNNGQFYECLNMAALWKLPIIYVVENNFWAIGMAHERATSDTDIYRKGPAFGMPGYQVDGMDVLAVREAAQQAIARARAGEGPTLLECITYRFRGHSLADPDELRSPEEKEFWRQRDPIKQLERYALEHNLMTEADFQAIHAEVSAVIEDAVLFALESPEPTLDELHRFVFAEDE
ncbi:pyruvate dehydrogenase (acetyl-transferring) E1 component subunit alpha [Synechococcus sp. R50.1]|jgi:pyruvate dehydrogenase E1 component alpha subunit|uniref:pyruvate dehydrogenase (acetyl-transferring) E1 component subunit alpha n=1 Tax=unclassified Synechococcus TaxID=2626047 RepID=UPI0000694A90|nr:pyruvate dehydrogenase (acetyl-transferring) E1 component subunit alpha [Synechococcus sp. JA-2-3B'a(2-13)]ABD01297.1 dehydrogenase E1 component, alpha subunit [Synechococcus sp. JA-2-3B'a(2-13)]